MTPDQLNRAIAEQVSTQPKCEDCIHFDEDNAPTVATGKTLYGCTHDRSYNGWCDLERMENGTCGPTGNNFEAK